MVDARLAAFVGVAALLTIIPGADTRLVVRNSLAGGRAGGLLTTLGICSGLFVHAMLSAVGVSAVVAHSATAFETLKILGAGVLFVLGAQSLRSWGWGLGSPCLSADYLRSSGL